MNLLISKLSGLRVLCGETINNCLPIHKIFAQATEENIDEDGQRIDQNQDDPFGSTTMERQNKQQQKLANEEEEEERKYFKEDLTNNSTQFSKNELELQDNPNDENDDYDKPFITSNPMTMQSQNVFDTPANVVSTKPKTSKKPMLGMIDEDKIQKVEKNDPVDEVDYFSQMNMGMPAIDNSSKAASKTTKKQSKAQIQEVKPDDLFQDEKKVVESKFNMNHDPVEEAETAGWGDNDEDIDL